MGEALSFSARSVVRDLVAGLVVFLVALPLCLGIAHASGAPLMAGLITGIVAGVLVSWLSGSQTSVSGPAAGLTAVVLHYLELLGSFEALLLAIILCGLLQIGMGLIRLGFLALFVPSSVIKGLLAAIGIILILKQVPHVFGHDPDYEGDFAFIQPDGRNTFSELFATFLKIEPGATVVGLTCLALLIVWDRTRLKKSIIPAPLIAVMLGLALKAVFDGIGGHWIIDESHLVQVPVLASLSDWPSLLNFPRFGQLVDPNVYIAGVTLALVASLETLLNLEAVDRIDPKHRVSPPNRELVAQGIGNTLVGFLGGIPMTSVIVRSSVNVQSGAQTRLSAFVHGLLLAGSILFVPQLLNAIPLSALAAVLVMTGVKLSAPSLFRSMWKEGRSQFLPFVATVLAIVFTDLLIGVMIGLGVSLVFILRSNLKRPFLADEEHYVGGRVLRLELANQISFLNKAALVSTLEDLPMGSQVILDAKSTDYIDPDVLDFLRDFQREAAPARGVRLSLVGFKEGFGLDDQIEHEAFSTRELHAQLTPAMVVRHLKDGNERFARGRQRHLPTVRQLDHMTESQVPFAVILSCADSRTSVDLIFDLVPGDVFSIRIAGNVAADKVLGSIEYACLIAGAKLILVLGHSHCGTIQAASNFMSGKDAELVRECPHATVLIQRVRAAIEAEADAGDGLPDHDDAFVDRVARRNVAMTMEYIREQCPTLRQKIEEGEIGLAGGFHDLKSGRVTFFGLNGTDDFLDEDGANLFERPEEPARSAD